MTSMPIYPSGTGPTGPGGPLPRLAPPAEVLTSVKLWFASIIVGLVGGILVFALTDQSASVRKAMETNPSALTEAQLRTAETVGLLVGLVLASRDREETGLEMQENGAKPGLVED